VGSVAEGLETRDLTASSQQGWALDYWIQNDDGEELHAEALGDEPVQVVCVYCPPAPKGK
jgi:hypothetical protein